MYKPLYNPMSLLLHRYVLAHHVTNGAKVVLPQLRRKKMDETFWPSRQPGGCGLSWSEITVIKTDNIIVFQVVIWPVQLNPVNETPPLKEANFPAMS